METATTIVGDREKACNLPLFEVAVDKLCACCYERAWFTKNGGCSAIEFLMEKMPLKWVLSHQLCFLMGLMFVLLDLTGEVSAGTISRAKTLIDKLITRCNTPPTDELKVLLPFSLLITRITSNFFCFFLCLCPFFFLISFSSFSFFSHNLFFFVFFSFSHFSLFFSLFSAISPSVYIFSIPPLCASCLFFNTCIVVFLTPSSLSRLSRP